jgi:hypothetical protein
MSISERRRFVRGRLAANTRHHPDRTDPGAVEGAGCVGCAVVGAAGGYDGQRRGAGGGVGEMETQCVGEARVGRCRRSGCCGCGWRTGRSRAQSQCGGRQTTQSLGRCTRRGCGGTGRGPSGCARRGVPRPWSTACSGPGTTRRPTIHGRRPASDVGSSGYICRARSGPTMPRRRDPRVGAEGAPPTVLLRFELGDWPVTAPEPLWWQDRCPHESWPLQCARRAWTAARHDPPGGPAAGTQLAGVSASPPRVPADLGAATPGIGDERGVLPEAPPRPRSTA